MRSRHPSARLVAVLVSTALVLAGVTVGVAVAAQPAQPAAPAAAAPTTMFVVDTSGSMDGARLDQAKAALRGAVGSLPAGTAAGLRRYGGECGDPGTLEVPPATLNRDRLRTAVDGLAASGGTPTPDALRAAAADLPKDAPVRSVVLISDGASSCGDPCPVASELARELGVGFTVHTVGYQAPDAAEGELACIARETGGRYFTADRPEELAGAIAEVVQPAPVEPCAPVRFIAAAGSGQAYKAPGDLTISPQLEKTYDAFVAQYGQGSTRLQVLPYPAEPVDVITRNLKRWDGAASLLVENLPIYLGGKDAGVGALRTAVDLARNRCKDQKIVLAGYSQGALVVHEYLAQLAASGDEGTRSAIKAAVLLADPARVSGTQVTELGSAFAARSHGICQYVGAVGVGCFRNARLADVPERFRRVTVSVCFSNDPVCDTSTVARMYAVNTPEGRQVLTRLAQDSHTTLLAKLPNAGTAGRWAARVVRRG